MWTQIVAVTIGGKFIFHYHFLVIVSRGTGVAGVSQGVGGAWLLILLVAGFTKEEEEER